MKPPFKFSWELITPEIAREMLTHNPPKLNRKLKQKSVAAFAADMVSGNWSPSHQGIAFDIDGNLIDGQNRLGAIVKSGVSVPFLICRNVPKRIDGVKSNVMDTLDRGVTRSISDVLKISHGQAANPHVVAGICAMIPRLVIFHIAGTHDVKRLGKVTLSQTLAVLDLYKKSLKFVAENCPAAKLLRSSPIGGAVVLAHAVAPEKAEEFYRLFASGAGIAANSPVLVIRNRCLNEPLGRGSERLARIELALQVLQAVYAFTSGNRLERFGKAEAKVAAHHFINRQPKNVAAIERIFPTLETAAQVTTAANWKPSAKAEALIRAKEMSDRLRKGPGVGRGAVAKMNERIARGQLGSPIR